MKKHFYSGLIASFLFLTGAVTAQTASLTTIAFAESVDEAAVEETSTRNSTGVFRTMESVRHGMVPGIKGVKVKVEQPVCPLQHGAVTLVNPSGEKWRYKVIQKKGTLITEGEVGYDRKIGKLETGEYLIQFMLPDSSSFLDQFTIKEGEGLQLSFNTGKNAAGNTNSPVALTAVCESANEFTWDFGDGSHAYGNAAVTHVYKTAGTYKVSVTANNFDCSSTETCTVTVTGGMASSPEDN